MYNGPPDPLLGMTPYENVRRTAQVMSKPVWDNHKGTQVQSSFIA